MFRSYSRRRRLVWTLALVVGLVPLTATAAPNTKPLRPDLKVISGSVKLSGGKVTGSFAVKNAGKKKAKASTAAIQLDGDTVQTRSLRSVKKGKTKDLAFTLTAAPGTYVVTACADSKKKVKETKEKNNCRSLGHVTVPPTTSPTAPSDPIPYTENTVFKVGEGPGEYWLYVPQTYDDSHQTPTRLVVFLHGCGDTSWNQLDTIKDSLPSPFTVNYLVMAPGGRDGQCWNTTTDPTMVLEAIADLKTHFNIAPKRVIIGGYDSGSILAGKVAFANANSFACLLVMVGRPFTSDSDRTSALAGAAWKINIVWRAHAEDTVFPIATVNADQSALLGAGFPSNLNTTAGDHGYSNGDVAYVFGQISDAWTAP